MATIEEIESLISSFKDASKKFRFRAYTCVVMIFIVIALALVLLLYVPKIVDYIEKELNQTPQTVEIELQILELERKLSKLISDIPENIWLRKRAMMTAGKNVNEIDLIPLWDFYDGYFYEGGTSAVTLPYNSNIFLSKKQKKLYRVSFDDGSTTPVKLPSNSKIEDVVVVYPIERNKNKPEKIIIKLENDPTIYITDMAFSSFTSTEVSFSLKKHTIYEAIQTKNGICAIFWNRDSYSNNSEKNIKYLAENFKKWQSPNKNGEDLSSLMDIRLGSYSGNAVIVHGDNNTSNENFLSVDGCQNFSSIENVEYGFDVMQPSTNTTLLVTIDGVYKYSEPQSSLVKIKGEPNSNYVAFKNSAFQITTDGVLTKLNKSDEWEEIKNFPQFSNDDAVSFSKVGDALFLANGVDISYSKDGIEWLPFNIDIFYNIDAMYIYPSNIIEATSITYQRIETTTRYVSTDNGKSFKKLGNFPYANTDLTQAFYFPDLWVGVTPSGEILTSIDSGDSWLSSDIPDWSESNRIAWLPEGKVVITNDNGHIYYRKNISELLTIYKESTIGSEIKTEEEKSAEFRIKQEKLESLLEKSQFFSLPAQKAVYEELIEEKKKLIDVLQEIESQKHSVRIEKHVIRFSVFAAMLYMVQVLVSAYRYNAKLSDYFSGRFDVLKLAFKVKGDSFKDTDMSVLVSLLSPNIDFGKSGDTPIESIISAAQKFNSGKN